MQKNMTDVLRLQLCTKVDYQGGRYVYLQSKQTPATYSELKYSIDR